MGQHKLKTLAVAVIIASAWGHQSLAATLTNAQIQAMINQAVAQKTQGLQQEVRELRTEVVSLRRVLRTKPVTVIGPVPRPSASTYLPPLSHETISTGPRIDPSTLSSASPATTSSGPISAKPSLPAVLTTDVGSQIVRNNVLTGIYLAGTPVFTSPYLGEHSAYDGSDLVVNQANINFDTRILKQQQAMANALLAKGLPLPAHPVVELSGDVEAIGNILNTHPGNTRGDINLADAQMDLYAQVNPCVFGFISFQWQDQGTSLYRVVNGNINIEKAFITVGNFNKTPFYASIGQLFVPFGQYSSFMLSDTLPKIMARTRERAAVFGFAPQGDTGMFGSVYTYRSDTSSNAKAASGGVDLGYRFANWYDLKGEFAIGGNSNIADGQGMQINGAPSTIPFAGFGMSKQAENIGHAIPAADINGKLSYKNLTLIAEYVDTARSFDRDAMTFNRFGARPSAGQLEANYAFTIDDKPGNIGFTYQWTNDALALLLPRQRYMAIINYSFWRSTLASLEFRHDVNYSHDTVATGASSAPFHPLNKYINLVTFQMAVFY